MYILIEKPKMKNLGMTFWPFIWIRDKNDSLTLEHEKIHILQQQEMLIIFAPIIFGIFWLVYRGKGYRAYELYRRNPISMDAWFYETMPKLRPRYAWWKFIWISKEAFLMSLK